MKKKVLVLLLCSSLAGQGAAVSAADFSDAAGQEPVAVVQEDAGEATSEDQPDIQMDEDTEETAAAEPENSAEEAGLLTDDIGSAEEFSAFSDGSSAEQPAVGAAGRVIVDRGTEWHRGGEIEWYFYDDGELVISGSGKIWDYQGEERAPWVEGYSQKISTVLIQGNITYIGNDAFKECSNLTSVKFPYSLTGIGTSAFSGCSSLTSIGLPNGVTNIGDQAFAECRSLTEIIMSRSMQTIGDDAFKNAGVDTGNPTRILYGGSESDWNNVKVTLGDNVVVDFDYVSEYEPGAGLIQDDDGEYRYYVDGVFQKDFAGVVAYEGGKYFVANGLLCKDANGLNLYDDTWYFLLGGKVQQWSGLAYYDGNWFYILTGVLNPVSGLVPYEGKWFAFSLGRMAQEANGLWQDPDTGEWYFLSGGQVQSQHTGVAMYDNEFFYIEEGKLAVDFRGIIEYDGAKFKVSGGQLYGPIK